MWSTMGTDYLCKTAELALHIEDYALIGHCHTAGLVGRDGSIDWLCFPRFDPPSIFGALLGTADHGRGLLAPAGEVLSTSRRYEEDSFILVTRWETAEGSVEVTDFMPHGDRRADVIRRGSKLPGEERATAAWFGPKGSPPYSMGCWYSTAAMQTPITSFT
jgi:GH15 family glucan-1,4-alpha-glucosidase